MEAKRVATKTQLDQAFQIRVAVFVEEQGVPLADEFDEHDANAEHILVYFEGLPVGTGRMRVVDEFAKLERICLLAPYRKYGLGKMIIQTLEQLAREKGMTKAKLHGQTQAEGFYQKLGYETHSPVFMEDGIPHVLMVKNL
ncbi:GNAT family N-acetyltransferase [Ammoniphilus sp. CFH 90114]|uniref:GNAT family N-acetyltransferase n=1 Tax=Ammoniphilus sp. CFH 90114 TaxID=2493665 RepID=UPI00100DE6DA|nr:GNAT family N-acetyltransferase [Ammoniphilus sp. CFH 90114]RXT03883.1 GNAT family N-acetyltransferase [Ammoniphilus sp. CFH 90114]